MIDQDEFGGEKNTGDEAKPQRAVVLEQGNTAQSGPGRNQQGGNERAHGSLRNRWNVMNGEFGRNLVETPGQAQPDHDAGRKRVKRTRGGCVILAGQDDRCLTPPCNARRRQKSR